MLHVINNIIHLVLAVRAQAWSVCVSVCVFGAIRDFRLS